MEVDIPHGLEVGSTVEVPKVDGYGVIHWIGFLPQVEDKLVAGLELVRIQIIDNLKCDAELLELIQYAKCQGHIGRIILPLKFALRINCRERKDQNLIKNVFDRPRK